MNIQELSNEELIQLFIENNYSLSKIEKTYELGKSSMERLFKKRGIDYNTIRREHANQIVKEYELNPNKCLNCGKPFSYKERNKTFCNKSCAASYNNKQRTKEIYEKISTSLKEKYANNSKPNEDKSKKEIIEKEKKILICQWCGKPITNSYAKKFCSNKCDAEFRTNQRLQQWLSGKYFINPNNKIPDFIRKYLYKRSEYKCEKCGFEGYNPVTGNSILQIHHIDGDASNNFENNLQVLCPNCHAMTDSYMALNKGKSARDKRYNT